MSKPPKLSREEIAEKLRRANLDPAQWDLAGIMARTNDWIADYHLELTAPEVKTWSPQLQAAQYDEFGKLAAVDFFEQCVIETGPDSVPWQDLQDRVETGEFETWPPIWEATRPVFEQIESTTEDEES